MPAPENAFRQRDIRDAMVETLEKEPPATAGLCHAEHGHLAIPAVVGFSAVRGRRPPRRGGT